MAEVRRSGPVIEAAAGEGVSGHRAVVVLGDEAFHADKDTPAHRHNVRGVSTGAAAEGTTAQIQVFGPMVEPSWSWTPNAPIFVGSSGQLTQTPPTSGFSQQIAFALTATKIFIDPQISIAKG